MYQNINGSSSAQILMRSAIARRDNKSSVHYSRFQLLSIIISLACGYRIRLGCVIRQSYNE